MDNIQQELQNLQKRILELEGKRFEQALKEYTEKLSPEEYALRVAADKSKNPKILESQPVFQRDARGNIVGYGDKFYVQKNGFEHIALSKKTDKGTLYIFDIQEVLRINANKSIEGLYTWGWREDKGELTKVQIEAKNISGFEFDQDSQKIEDLKIKLKLL